MFVEERTDFQFREHLIDLFHNIPVYIEDHTFILGFRVAHNGMGHMDLAAVHKDQVSGLCFIGAVLKKHLPPPAEQEINFVLLMEVVVPHIKVCRTNHVFHHNAVSFAVILGRIALNHAVQPCCFHEMLLFS